MMNSFKKSPVSLSIGILARNAGESIGPMLESLFRQSIFENLCARHELCEVVVIAHGCADDTAAIAREVCERMERKHGWPDSFVARVLEFPAASRGQAWNRFVHEFSAVEARYLAVVRGDVLFHHRDAFTSLVTTLRRRPRVSVVSSRPCADQVFRERRTAWERIAGVLADETRGGQGQINRHVYCLRAEVARNLYLPREFDGGETSFIRLAVCTDFFTREPDPMRSVFALEAVHVYRAEIEPGDVLRRRVREIIGQTGAHVLLQHVQTLPVAARRHLADTFRQREARDPGWFGKSMAWHVHARTFFWQLFPGCVRLGWRGLAQLPVAPLKFGLTVVAGCRAHRFLRQRTLQALRGGVSSQPVSA